MEHLILSNIQNFWGTMPPEVNFLSPTAITISRMHTQSFAIDELLPSDEHFVSKLKKIDFSSTRLHGTIPTDIGWIPNLEEINFAQGFSLEGNLPPQIRLLENLKVLSLQGNRLSGSLPFQLVSLSSLEHVRMDNNLLTGGLPKKWCALTNLQTLRLDHNFLEGAIPRCFVQLPLLEDFSYEGNQLIPP